MVTNNPAHQLAVPLKRSSPRVCTLLLFIHRVLLKPGTGKSEIWNEETRIENVSLAKKRDWESERESWSSQRLPALTRYGSRGLSEWLMFFRALLSQLHKEFRAALLLKDEALSHRSLGDLLSVTDSHYDPLQTSFPWRRQQQIASGTFL